MVRKFSCGSFLSASMTGMWIFGFSFKRFIIIKLNDSFEWTAFKILQQNTHLYAHEFIVVEQKEHVVGIRQTICTSIILPARFRPFYLFNCWTIMYITQNVNLDVYDTSMLYIENILNICCLKLWDSARFYSIFKYFDIKITKIYTFFNQLDNHRVSKCFKTSLYSK